MSPECKLGANEIYERVKGVRTFLAELAEDDTDYKALIAKAQGTQFKLELAQRERGTVGTTK